MVQKPNVKVLEIPSNWDMDYQTQVTGTTTSALQPEFEYDDNIPDTPSPKKNKVGGSGSAR